MARRSVWQGIRRWLRPEGRGRTEEAPAGATAPRSEPSGPEPHEWPSNVLPFVRPERPQRRPDGSEQPGRIAVGECLSDISSWSLEADGAAVIDDAAEDAELLEFLAADLDPVPADPVFRERLREQLWEMVVTDARCGADREEERRPRISSLTRRPDPA